MASKRIPFAEPTPCVTECTPGDAGALGEGSCERHIRRTNRRRTWAAVEGRRAGSAQIPIAQPGRSRFSAKGFLRRLSIGACPLQRLAQDIAETSFLCDAGKMALLSGFCFRNPFQLASVGDLGLPAIPPSGLKIIGIIARHIFRQTDVRPLGGRAIARVVVDVMIAIGAPT